MDRLLYLIFERILRLLFTKSKQYVLAIATKPWINLMLRFNFLFFLKRKKLLYLNLSLVLCFVLIKSRTTIMLDLQLSISMKGGRKMEIKTNKKNREYCSIRVSYGKGGPREDYK